MFTGPSQTGKETCARAVRRVGIVSAVLVLVLAACGKERPFAAESSSDLDLPAAGGGPAQAPAAAGAAETCAEPPCTSSPEQVEPIGGVMGGAADTDQLSGASSPDAACADGATESCGPPAEEGTCRFGTRSCVAGSWGECAGAVLPGARDCSSVEDNDCDGQPDNTIDDVCRCPAAGTQPCDEHPGLDGRGACRAGVQTCILAADSATSDWGECTGSVGPQPADSCEVASDDADCDGTPNGGCTCVEGTIIACGPEADTGECVRGTSTCTNGQFTPCQGAVFPTRRDCTSGLDNDCDGLPDDTLDATCACVVGETRACGAHPGRDGNGSCQAGQQVCQAGAQNGTSAFGACVGSVGPALRDLCTVPEDDSDCDGLPNDGCACIAGQGNAPCASDPNNSRCNAQGQCAPCQGNADCSLVGGGRNLCVEGVCSAARCGDGIVQADRGEECDDGGIEFADGCTPDCRIAHAPVGASAFGGAHVCMLQPSGEIICWGTNGSGELGDGSTASGIQGPTQVSGIANAVQVVVGPSNTCAVRDDGRLACWGLGFTPRPTDVLGLTAVSQVAIASTQVCALSNGRVSCALRETGASVAGFVDKGLDSVTQISAGNGQVCALRSDGSLRCWGSNNAGQLGIGQPSNPIDLPQLALVTNVAEVAAGGETTCVRLRDGNSQCFGAGPLGSPAAPSSSSTPEQVVNLPFPVRFAAATGSRCALLADQTVSCWGIEPFGDADGAPRSITLPGRAVEIGAGSDVMCATLEDRSVYCWGGNLIILGLDRDPRGDQVAVELAIP
jgi:Regulator of Chromosome Condensation (RCC1) repeat protein/regulator of chromosome condensation (RCC1) repeat-containing protein